MTFKSKTQPNSLPKEASPAQQPMRNTDLRVERPDWDRQIIKHPGPLRYDDISQWPTTHVSPYMDYG